MRIVQSVCINTPLEGLHNDGLTIIDHDKKVSKTIDSMQEIGQEVEVLDSISNNWIRTVLVGRLAEIVK